jgi:GDSL-like lipase/acylhydrolase family protein
MRHHRQVGHGSSLLINLCILSVTVIVLLVAAECAVRWAYRDITTTADGTGYFTRRWRKRNVRLNALGFREQEFSSKKPEDIYRIAIVGDSFAEGQGVSEDDRFSNVLHKQLNSDHEGYQVLNFGRSGTETVHHVDILTDEVLPTEPDFVLLQWYVNDVEGSDKSSRPEGGRPVPARALLRRVREASALLSIIGKPWVTIQIRLGLLPSYEEYMVQRFADPDGPSSREAQAALQKFIDICKEHSVPLSMVLFGLTYARHSRLDFLLDRVLALCTREALTCIDTRGIFDPYNQGTRLWANRLDGHPGVLAHRLVADQLMHAFGDIWFRGHLKG